MQVVGHYLGCSFSSQFRQLWVNLKVWTLKILIKLMVVLLVYQNFQAWVLYPEACIYALSE